MRALSLTTAVARLAPRCVANPAISRTSQIEPQAIAENSIKATAGTPLAGITTPSAAGPICGKLGVPIAQHASQWAPLVGACL